jgi:hypothetical protein
MARSTVALEPDGGELPRQLGDVEAVLLVHAR